MFDSSELFHYAKVCDSAEIRDESKIGGDKVISGDTVVRVQLLVLGGKTSRTFCSLCFGVFFPKDFDYFV